MNKTRKIVLVAIITICTVIMVLTPVAFAQTSEVSSVSKTVQSRQYMELLNSVFSFVMQNYVDDVDPAVLYEGAMKGLMDSLEDPYTIYMEPTQQRSINDTTSGSFGGVGLSITKATTSTPEKPAYVEVSNPIEGSPGWRAGIHAGDYLVAINGVPTPDITMDEVLSMLRGKIGTPVEVTVRRGKNMEFTVTLERALIEVPTVKYGMIDDAVGKTGYLRIVEFTPLTPERVQEALDFFITQNFTSLIIDLRSNPGGLISSVEAVADKFIDEGPIVTTKGRYETDTVSYIASSDKTTMPKGIPIVVLIDGGSASASEILAGALKDTHKALLLGDKTYGKGSVQQPVPLPYNDGIKLTIARYYSPSDTNIDKIGIPPDYEVKFPALTEKEQEAYVNLMNENIITNYVDAHENMTESDIADYAKKLSDEYGMNDRLLRRLIRLAVNKTKGDTLYDLDYDIQLQAAIELVRSQDFNTLVSNTKTLKQLQEETLIEVTEE